MTLVFSVAAFRQLSRLDKNVQQRIVKKLNFYCSQEDPLNYAEKLVDSRFGQWRFRIGDYRVLFDVANDEITVLAVGHRKEIYR